MGGETVKIAFLSFYSGYVERGVEVWVEEVARRLAKRHEVWVFCGGVGGAKKAKKVYRQVEVPVGLRKDFREKDFTNSKWRRVFLDPQSRAIFGFTRQVLSYLKEEKFDVVMPMNGGWQTVLCRIAQWKLRKKLVVSGQSGLGWDDRWNLMWRPEAFAALTERQEKWARFVGYRGRVVKIPNGVDLRKFGPKVNSVELDLPRPVVLCVGALVASKRIELVIRAVARMRGGSLVVLGVGEEKSKLAEMGWEMLGKRFLLKQVSHREIPGYFSACDVFSLPSAGSEAFGIVYVEALASNKPVVAPDDESRREIVGGAGVLVEVEDVAAYARALEEAARVDWANEPRRQARKFDWGRIVREYEQLFGQLVSGT